MSARPVSMRWDDDLLTRLQRRARAAGSSVSALAQRYVDEALRASEHPGIVFRDGPAGRRAGLAAGPDVWEVVVVLLDVTDRGAAAIAAAAQEMGLSESQVGTASRYYGAFPAEVDDQVAENERVSREAFSAWQAEQRLLA